MATSRQTLLCDICTKRGQTNAAIGICSQCDQCQKQHQAFLATKTHKIIKFDSEQEISDHIHCDSCKEMENKNIPAAYICDQCRELYCESCKQLHLMFKATSDHDVSEINIAVKAQPPPIDSVSFISEFEKFTLYDVSVSDSGSASYQDQIECVNSSDFDGFNFEEDFDIHNLVAQFPVFQSSDGESKICLNKDDMDKMSAKVIGSFNGKITLGKKLLNLASRLHRDKGLCSFNGIICLNDGRLILSDYFNHKLKMFDKTYKIITTKLKKYCMKGMTKISEDEIAVVVYDTVYFYKVINNKFEPKKQRNIELGCLGDGISFNRGMLAVLCVTKNDNPLIKIYSMFGEEMSQIFLPNYKHGDIITLDSEEDRIYVSFDREFSCISQHGKLLWKFDFDGRDVVEFYNCLLVADYNGAIVLCTKDGRYRRTIIQDVEHLSEAKYIAYNPVTKQLYVTRFYKIDITIIQLQSDLSCRLP